MNARWSSSSIIHRPATGNVVAALGMYYNSLCSNYPLYQLRETIRSLLYFCDKKYWHEDTTFTTHISQKKQLLSLILYRDMIVYTTIYVQSLLWRYCDFLVDSCDRCTHLFQGHSTLISLSAAYIHRWTGLAWVRVMTCRLFGAKPLPEPSLFACLAQTLINSFAAWNGWKSPLHDMSTTISPRL